MDGDIDQVIAMAALAVDMASNSGMPIPTKADDLRSILQYVLKLQDDNKKLEDRVETLERTIYFQVCEIDKVVRLVRELADDASMVATKLMDAKNGWDRES